MSDLIDLLFEGVPRNSLDSLVERLLSESILNSVAASESPGLDLGSWRGSALEILEGAAPNSGCVSLNVDGVKIGGVRIVNPLIRVLMCDGSFDVFLHFLDSDLKCESVDVLDELHHASMEISRVADVGHVSCGYDPVSDQKTRFFFDAEKGPIRELW
ncbi:hypothetical protein [Stenotrophomonas sp.]|uniref:hypothetical protein n=1 Tax=Stenotrophomonas sp. TaxID=69392 RepID=UPI0028A9E455|nr:hypothetical protein [Stenotrophomonas sp.]